MCIFIVLTKSFLHQEKKQMITHNKELLMAFVYFDQSHCGYLLERDLEEILYTLGLHLSRAQVNKTQFCASIISPIILPLPPPFIFLSFLHQKR